MDASTIKSLGLNSLARSFEPTSLDFIDPNSFGRVAVLTGDNSPETEVSLSSGEEILAALKARNIRAQILDPATDLALLTPKNFDRVFLALHGPHGEDGEIQGYLERIGLPYTGSGICSSALCMDKARSKCMFRQLGILTPDSVLSKSIDCVYRFADEVGYPILLKPNAVGSSVGVYTVFDSSMVEQAYCQASAFGLVLAEKYVEGVDYTVGILGDETLPSIKIVPSSGMYNYEAKYQAGKTHYICPSDLDAPQAQAIADMTYVAYQALGCRHYGRADWMRGVDGQLWLLEMNTLPGMTPTSLIPKAAKAKGMSYEALVQFILFQTLPLSIQEQAKMNSCV